MRASMPVSYTHLDVYKRQIWNSYLLAREPRDRNATCDRFMDKMSRLTGVFQNETMSFDREDVYKRQPQRCIGSIVCAIGKSCAHGSLDLFAGLSGVHFIQDV